MLSFFLFNILILSCVTIVIFSEMLHRPFSLACHGVMWTLASRQTRRCPVANEVRLGCFWKRHHVGSLPLTQANNEREKASRADFLLLLLCLWSKWGWCRGLSIPSPASPVGCLLVSSPPLFEAVRCWRLSVPNGRLDNAPGGDSRAVSHHILGNLSFLNHNSICPALFRLFYWGSLSDITDIRYIVNFDYPAHAEDYVHRIGRTGRSDRKGTAYTFYNSDNPKTVIALPPLSNPFFAELNQKNLSVDASTYQSTEGGKSKSPTRTWILEST